MSENDAARRRTLEGLGLLPAARVAGPAPGDGPVAGLAVDSRKVKPGFVFFGLKGSVLDGAEFVQYALRMGAAAAVVSAEGLETALAGIGEPTAPILVHDDPRRALALAAARFYGAQPETMVAVTGTNGKTSVASFARQLWVALGRRAVNFGTTGVEGAVARPLTHTTPEPITLHALLADLAAEGVTHAAMEASSHGLAQRRLDGVRLAAGAFTNISRDHLDYHPDFDDYLAAKAGLFTRVLPQTATAVINADDPMSARLAELSMGRGLDVLTVGREGDLKLLGAEFGEDGQRLHFEWDGAERTADLALIGGFQGHNALIAAGLVIAAGETPDAVFAALPGLEGVRGRMERVATRLNGAQIYVDYAHTPDSVAKAIAGLRLHTPGQLVAIIGAGGDRDPGKRPLMGKAAAEGADAVIVTDDNPRTEDPAKIRAAVMAGCPDATEIGDRAEAILAGVDMLGPQDRLLIAGKGHETGQIVGDQVREFDDSEQARAAVAVLDAEEAE